MEAIAWILATAALTLLGWAIKDHRNKKDLRNLPDPHLRQRLLKQIREKRAQGESYQQCLRHLQDQGLRKGVAEGMMIDVELEEPPDMNSTRTLVWQQWSCEYPGNWKEQHNDEDLPREMSVTIAGLGGSGISFYSHAEINVDEIIQAQKSLLSHVTESGIREWGAFQGKGVRLKGVQTIYKLPMEVLIFQATETDPLILVQIVMEEEEPGVGLAFDLIESSFKQVVKSTPHDSN